MPTRRGVGIYAAYPFTSMTVKPFIPPSQGAGIFHDAQFYSSASGLFRGLGLCVAQIPLGRPKKRHECYLVPEYRRERKLKT